ncbi:alginate O-acetyltransferase AlgF [Xanthobacter sp. TB0136]|uniref:alginate O-acetyltransferase AlgF n=1 Tax=Xanthobacter sp. TB0136 TaxID=3459177 RepID=UPI004039933A
MTFRAFTLSLVAGLAAACTLPAAMAQADGALAQLYAPRPPAGSSFVRLVNPLGKAVSVKIGEGKVQELGGASLASPYAIIKGATPFTVTVDGVTSAPLEVKPDSFTTLVPQLRDGALTFQHLDDSSDAQNALKAELRFYNLAAECPQGELQIVPSGQGLFTAVAPNEVKSRAINPVQAELRATCGAAFSTALALPRLEPGDHYSLFLTGTASAPQLHGQVSATEAYQR